MNGSNRSICVCVSNQYHLKIDSAFTKSISNCYVVDLFNKLPINIDSNANDPHISRVIIENRTNKFSNLVYTLSSIISKAYKKKWWWRMSHVTSFCQHIWIKTESNKLFEIGKQTNKQKCYRKKSVNNWIFFAELSDFAQ